MSAEPIAFLDWAAANGFRRFGEVSTSGVSLTEDLRGGCTYVFVVEGKPINAGETGEPLRYRMRQIHQWMWKAEPRAVEFRQISGDRFDVWARPQQNAPVLDGEAPDRWAVECWIIQRWRPPFNKRGVMRPTVKP